MTISPKNLLGSGSVARACHAPPGPNDGQAVGGTTSFSVWLRQPIVGMSDAGRGNTALRLQAELLQDTLVIGFGIDVERRVLVDLSE